MFAALACTLAVDDGSQGSARRPVVGAERPAVILLAPAQGNRYALGTEVLLYAEASDLGAGVAKVEFYDNFDGVIGTVNASNPNGDPTLSAIVPWTPPNAQTHFIRVQAFRADGTDSTREEVSIDVVEAPGASSNAPQQQSQAAPDAAETQPVQEAATAAEAPTQPVTNASLPATVNVQALNVRVAPDINAGIAATALNNGTQIQVVGRSTDNLWFATPISGGGVGWVFSNGLTVQGDSSTLPLVAP
jgi:hypothetical protein